MEDSKILELFFARDEEAIRQTQKTYGGRLHHLAEGIVKDKQDAEESVSDTYLKAWETIPPQKPTYYFAYLAKLCRHFALGRLDWNNAKKRKAEVVSLTQEMEGCIPDSRREVELSGKELGQLLDRFLRQQRPENRMIFLRRYWYVDTVGEIARRYGISESAVSMRLNRTKQKLKVFLEQEGVSV